MQSKKPIGIFDSGLGGLTTARELMRVLPNEDIIYFGDTGRVPYGNKSVDTIIKYANQDANFLLKNNVKAIIAACGTVSSIARGLYDTLPVPYTGVLRPTAKSALKATKNGKIGVIGTTATINSHSYQKHIAELSKDAWVFEQDCPLFVPLVENGFTDPEDTVVSEVIRRYVEPLIQKGVDTLILGCTHYPILKNAIAKVMGEGVTLVDSGRATALYTAELLKSKNLLNHSKEEGTYKFFVSDTPHNFEHLAGVFLQKDIEGMVTQIDIEAY
ncbi:MAG: glutamate racemase [Eubacteriales bacterium]|nr:glutamate racemase [Eubacteriales bacterium]